MISYTSLLEDDHDHDDHNDYEDDAGNYEAVQRVGGDLLHLLAHIPASKAGQARLPLVLHLLLSKVRIKTSEV